MPISPVEDFVMRAIATAMAVLFGAVTPVFAAEQATPAPAAIPVSVVAAEKKPVAKSLDFVGRVEAIQRVEINARVTGYLEKVAFKEGELIKAGSELYSIEKGLFEAAVGQAEGAQAKDKAAKTLTEVQLQRAEELLQKQSGTQVARDQALAADQSAQGALLVDDANLKTAKINLGYTNITSPIDGKVGKTNITVGNVVGPNTGPLTVVVSQDPMYVSFPVSQRDFLRAQEAQNKVDLTGIKATLNFSDGTSYKHEGKINFVDVQVDKATDTILVRATFPNPDYALVDGQLVRVKLESGEAEERIVIPQAALISDQEGTYVFVVEDGKAAVRRVKTAGPSGTGIIVDQGLTVGDQVVVEGGQSLRPGVAVKASPLQSRS
jgi:membrane fusion protein (multidrug efflux system)